MENQNLKRLSRKTIIINIITLILILIAFQRLFYEASMVNNEISFQNYLNNNANQLRINDEEILEPKELKFPLYLMVLISIILILLIENMYNIGKLYKDNPSVINKVNSKMAKKKSKKKSKKKLKQSRKR